LSGWNPGLEDVVRKMPKESPGEIEFNAGEFSCRLGWSGRGIRRFHFRKRERAANPIKRGSGCGLGPAFVREALSKLEDYFNCMKVDFKSIPLDLSGLGEFSKRVYLAAGKIPYGETVSYLDLAGRAGSPMASRAVGACMKKNPIPVFIPCHRVIRKDGRPGGFTSPDGPGMKVKLLLMEGVNL